jgi:hypothetical protein
LIGWAAWSWWRGLPGSDVVLPAPGDSALALADDEAPQGGEEETTSVDTLTLTGPLAPEILSDIWLNSAPLSASDLRGKVVLVEFWTFG